MTTLTTIPDLWPADFGTDQEPSPASILRQQGYKLGERTNQIIYGEVESRETDSGQFEHAMYLSAPYLKVKKGLVTVTHPVALYPANVSGATGSFVVRSATELSDRLKAGFASPYVVDLIRSLLAQARDLDADE